MNNDQNYCERVLITGAIGDVITIESWVPIHIRSQIKEVIWASRRADQLIPLFDLIPTYQHVTHTLLSEDWEGRWAFYTKDQVSKHFGVDLSDVEDLSIMTVFAQYQKASRNRLWVQKGDGRVPITKWEYSTSSFLLHDLADISHYTLPDEFAFVQPTTPQNRDNLRRARELRPVDWEGMKKWCDDKQLQPLAVVQGDDEFPEWLPVIRNPTLSEAIEILKKSKGYIGIDSCFSILAAQIHDHGMVRIKSRNSHLIHHADCYYPRMANDKGLIVSRL